MASRRDGLLQQMGIVQYQLRRPRVLRGEVAVSLPTGVRLAIVADSLPDEGDPLLSDVLRALTLSRAEIGLLTPEQWAMLGDTPPCPHWRLGSIEADDCAMLHSPPLAELHHNPAARRALWQQICHHEFDLLTHGS